MRREIDWWLIGAIGVLVGVGLVIQVSIAPAQVPLQAGFLLVGLAVFVLALMIHPGVYWSLAKFFYLGSIVFLILPFLIGELTRGAFRWIAVGPITIQPSEIAKPLIIIGLAKFFSTRKLDSFKEIVWGGLLVAVPVFIVFLQPDLGSSLVLVAGWLAIVFVAGIPLRWLAGLVVAIGSLVPLFWVALKGYQRDRLVSFLDPNRDPLGTGYNVIQSVVAVGSGGWIGRGLGRGTQSHLRFLPENHTDFVFASLAEELGVVGTAMVLGAFGVILWRLVKIAANAPSSFERYLVAGMMGMIFFQILVSVGMNMGIMPVTGVPLPFISQGGSSLVSVFFSLGIVQGVAMRSRQRGEIQIG